MSELLVLKSHGLFLLLLVSTASELEAPLVGRPHVPHIHMTKMGPQDPTYPMPTSSRRVLFICTKSLESILPPISIS